MNNKEFIGALADRLGISSKEAANRVDVFLADIVEEFEAGNAVVVQGFGVFEVKKKAERISVNPSTKVRMLIPPKLTLSFKPGSVLKEKFK